MYQFNCGAIVFVKKESRDAKWAKAKTQARIRMHVLENGEWCSKDEIIMPRGANPKREHEYEELKHKFKEEGRYKGREEEVASRIVNKQRSEYGETKAEKAKDRAGKSPDRALPIKNYQHLTIPQIEGKFDSLSEKELKQVEEYEKQHKNRKTLIEDIEECLAAK
jgi:hypothetical protein